MYTKFKLYDKNIIVGTCDIIADIEIDMDNHICSYDLPVYELDGREIDKIKTLILERNNDILYVQTKIVDVINSMGKLVSNYDNWEGFGYTLKSLFEKLSLEYNLKYEIK